MQWTQTESWLYIFFFFSSIILHFYVKFTRHTSHTHAIWHSVLDVWNTRFNEWPKEEPKIWIWICKHMLFSTHAHTQQHSTYLANINPSNQPNHPFMCMYMCYTAVTAPSSCDKYSYIIFVVAVAIYLTSLRSWVFGMFFYITQYSIYSFIFSAALKCVASKWKSKLK